MDDTKEANLILNAGPIDVRGSLNILVCGCGE